MFYFSFAALGYEVAVEESSSRGRLDMAVRAAGHVYLFEFKVTEMAPPGSAPAQLRERRYADKYRAAGEPIHLVGVEFSRATRNVTAFEVAGAGVAVSLNDTLAPSVTGVETASTVTVMPSFKTTRRAPRRDR